MFNLINYFKPVYETNDIDAWIPEVWANESVAILVENMVIANLVHTDFKDEIAQFGDIVNTRQPAAFEGKRKGNTDNVTIQNSTATNIPVPLNQHWHTSFLIRDGEESKSFKDLVNEYLDPAVVSIAQAVDRVVLGQHHHFMGNNAGGIGEITSTNAREKILDVRKVLNTNKAHVSGRRLILGPTLETLALKDEAFTDADRVGDDGTALREASLGRKFGFDTFMCQNMSEYTYADTATAGLVQGAHVAGSTSITTADDSTMAAGDMILIAGDMTPQHILTVTGTSVSGADIITIAPGLRDAVVNQAAISIWDGAIIDLTSDADYSTYAINHYDHLRVDGFTANKQPQVGQQIIMEATAGTPLSTDLKYTIVDVDYTAAATNCEILLDRPLEAAITNDTVISLYPTGNYGFAFHRNCLALVSRPLAAPKTGTGALSAVVNFGGIGIRVVITYDGNKQGHLVTVDLLCGVKVLDTSLGAVLLG